MYAYVIVFSQVTTPALTYVIGTKSLFVNRTIIKICESHQEGIVQQFMLHFILNLAYFNELPHYFTYLEIICGLRSATDCTRGKTNKALKSFLQKYCSF